MNEKTTTPIDPFHVIEDVLTNALSGKGMMGVQGFYARLVIESYKNINGRHFNDLKMSSRCLAALFNMSKNTVKKMIDKCRAARCLSVIEGDRENVNEYQFIFKYKNAGFVKEGVDVILANEVIHNCGKSGSVVEPLKIVGGSECDPQTPKGGSNIDHKSEFVGQELGHIAIGIEIDNILKQLPKDGHYEKVKKIVIKMKHMGFTDIEKFVLERDQLDHVPKQDQMPYLIWVVLDEFSNIKKGGSLRKLIKKLGNYNVFKLAQAKAEIQEMVEKQLLEFREGQKMQNTKDPGIFGTVTMQDGIKNIYVESARTTFRLQDEHDLKLWKPAA